MTSKILSMGGMYLVIITILSLIPLNASANLISFNFTGNLDSASYNDDFSASHGNPFSIGDSFAGTLRYDLDAIGGALSFTPPIVDGTGMSYRYTQPPSGMSLTINGYTFQSNPVNNEFMVWVTNANAGESRYVDELYFWETEAVSAFNFDTSWLDWELQDPTKLVLDSDNLPTEIDLSAWTQNFGLSFLGSYDSDLGGPVSLYFTGIVDQINPVPEPSTFILLGAGLAGLGFLVRRIRKE